MADEEAVRRLDRYAKAVARKVLWRFGRAQDDFRHDDISQSLLLEGWKVWRDTGDEAKARHRMSTGRKCGSQAPRRRRLLDMARRVA